MPNTKRVEELITFILPFLIPAGRYASEIQARVQSQSDKCSTEENSFATALTDADLSIQNFFEVLLLSQFPDIDFFGEEAASSHNMKYFSASEKIRVLLDPIDGTLYYKNKSPLFSILFTFCSDTAFLGNIVYQPRLQRCFVCIKDRGTFELTEAEMTASRFETPITLDSASKRIIMYRCPEAKAALKSDYEVFDLDTDYDRSADFPYELAGILRGEQLAILTSHPQLIDSASIAFAVREAGGYVCDLNGKQIVDSDAFRSGLYETLLVATTKEKANSILQILTPIE